MARNPLQTGDDTNPLASAPFAVGDPTDPMAYAGVQNAVAADPLTQWLADQRAKSDARGVTPIWNVNNPVGTQTTRPQQFMSMPDPSFRPGVFVGGGTVPMSREQLEGMRQGQQEFYDQASLLAGVGPVATEGRAVTLASRRPLANPPPPRVTEPVVEVPRLRAFHGSPHKFDAFSDHAIGTGEGAQAYGYGHYVAENEGVARGYRDMLGTRSMDLKDPDNMAAWMYHKNMGNRADAITELETSLQSAENYPKQYQPGDVDRFRTALDKLKSNVEMPPAPGHMYEVNVAADPEKFLHWDKPLPMDHPARDLLYDASGQHLESAYANMRNAGKDARLAMRNENLTGNGVYHQLSKLLGGGDAKAGAAPASKVLLDAGIPGIRYLDQGSRGAGEGSHNVVVFDPATMEIIRRYGLAGLMGGGAAAATQQQQPNPLVAP